MHTPYGVNTFQAKKKKMTFTHTGQDKTQKKNEKRKQMNRDRGSKKKTKHHSALL